MKKFFSSAKSWILLITLNLSLLATACSGVPEEKLVMAQDIFAQLAEVHNQVVESHRLISSDAYDEELTALAGKITQIESYNLYEMSEEEIDLLIEAMNSIIHSYQNYLETIENVRSEENAAVLVPLPVTLINETTFSFAGLALYEKGSAGTKTNVLENTPGFLPKQSLTGLIIERDVDNTPWILELEDAEGNHYELTLSSEDLSEEINRLTLTYDSELAQLICS